MNEKEAFFFSPTDVIWLEFALYTQFVYLIWKERTWSHNRIKAKEKSSGTIQRSHWWTFMVVMDLQNPLGYSTLFIMMLHTIWRTNLHKLKNLESQLKVNKPQKKKKEFISELIESWCFVISPAILSPFRPSLSIAIFHILNKNFSWI